MQSAIDEVDEKVHNHFFKSWSKLCLLITPLCPYLPLRSLSFIMKDIFFFFRFLLYFRMLPLLLFCLILFSVSVLVSGLVSSIFFFCAVSSRFCIRLYPSFSLTSCFIHLSSVVIHQHFTFLHLYFILPIFILPSSLVLRTLNSFHMLPLIPTHSKARLC